MIDFPPFPAVDEEYLAPNGVTYIWSGKTWTRTFNNTLSPTINMDGIDNVDTGNMFPKGNQHLIHDGSVWTDQNPNIYFPRTKGFYVYATTNYYPPSNSVNFWAEFSGVAWDSENAHDTVTSTYTIPIAGYWQMNVRIMGRDLREYSYMDLYLNGSKHRELNTTVDGPVFGDGYYTLLGVTFQHFDVGDELRIYCKWYGLQNYMLYGSGAGNTNWQGTLIQSD